MGFFDEPIREEAACARALILHLLCNHPTQRTPTDLLELADRYLRLNPDDTEVKAIRDRLAAPTRSA